MQYRGVDFNRYDNVSGFMSLERLLPRMEVEFLNTSASQGDYVGGAIASGTNTVAPASGVVTKNHPGVWRLQSSTTASSGFQMLTGPSMILLGGGESFSFVFMTPASFTNVTTRFGFMDTTTTAAVVDGVYFSINASGVITGNNSSNSTASATASLATLSTSAWYHARITINATATSVLFEVFNDAGASIASTTLTTNIPTATGRETGAGFVTTSAGTTAVDLLMVDYMQTAFQTVRTRGSTTGY